MKRYRIKKFTEEYNDYYLYTVRDLKTKIDVLEPTENKYEAINMCEYLNANKKTRRKPNKPTRQQYTKMIPN